MIKKPTFLIVTETWNTPDTAQSCTVDGYAGFHTCREKLVTSGGVGGGVSVFVDLTLNGSPVSDLSRCNQTIELCACQVYISKNKYILLLGVYRPHSDTINNFVAELNQIMNHRTVENASLVILAGDFNIDISEPSSSHCLLYLSLLQSHCFLPVITRPTRFNDRSAIPSENSPFPPINQPLTSASNLDHIWLGHIKPYVSGIILYEISDHLPTFLHFNFDDESTCSDKIKITRRPYSENNLNSLRNEITSTDWNQIIQPSLNPSIDYFKIFSDYLDKLYCKHFPIKIMHVSEKRFNNPWMTSHLKKLTVKKSDTYRKYLLGEISKNEKNIVRNQVNIAIRAAKNKYFNDVFEKNKNNSKKQWKIINNLMGRESKPKNTINKLIVGERDYEEPFEIAEQFNDFFSSIADNLESALPPPLLDSVFHLDNLENSFYMFPVTESECLSVIGNLKLTSTDLNCMPVKIFKLIAPEIIPILCIMINSSILTGTFPECLKLARITPVHKKGDKTSTNNYRPIASLPFLSKVYERLVANRIISFFEKFKLIDLSQFGFQRNKSTADALFHLTEYIYKGIDEKKLTLNIQIDLRKAFDTVNHKILLDKLFSYGFRGFAQRWLGSYLADRKQFVRINNCSSSIKAINIGVPQGSILGPLLFLFYINDISKHSKMFNITLFADDTTLSLSHSSLDQGILSANSELEVIHNWTIYNRLSVNVEKTETMLINRKLSQNSTNHLVFGGQNLSLTDCSTFLGVRLDSQLKFNNHISYIMNKLSKSVGIFSRIKNNLTLKAKCDYYYSHIFSHLSYNVIFWGKTHDCYLEPIILIQKRMVRLMTNSHFLAHTDPIFSELKFLKFPDIYLYFISIHMFNAIKQGKYQTENRRSARFLNQAEPTQHKYTSTQRCVSYMGPKTWNSLPNELRAITKIGTFKRKLKDHLISFYNP